MDIKHLLQTMTIEEKASLMSGLDQWHTKPVTRLGIPSILMTDGPHGIRRQVAENDMIGVHPSAPATCFPPAVNMASTFDRRLVESLGKMIAREAKAEGVSIVLGPGANIKRHPFGGRNFEYFSEDPLVSGIMASAYVTGVQQEGIGTSLKHYAMNNQETSRMMHDVIVDERAKQEIYLKGFRMAVSEAKPWTVMTSYNRVDGIYASEHPTLIHTLLRESFGFTGVTITDWGAMNNRVKALEAGLDLEMPSSQGHTDKEIVKACKKGLISVQTLDESTHRLLELIAKATTSLDQEATYDALEHHTFARKVAADSYVLLRNNGVLPLKGNERILLIGPFVRTPRYQGSGSSKINPTMIDHLDDIIRTEYPEVTLRVWDQSSTDEGFLLELALATVVIIMTGLPDEAESESFDRTTLSLPDQQNTLISHVCQHHDQVIVCLANGAPVTMPWIDGVAACLEVYLGGQAQAGAIADVIFGKVSPSGRLAETFYLDERDCLAHPHFPGHRMQVAYHESIFVGYRQTTTMGTKVLFPFGYGLSYASFAYADLVVNKSQHGYDVRVTVTNSSDVMAKEVIQVYLEPEHSQIRKPKRTLVAFDKVMLKAHETITVTLNVFEDSFKHYDVLKKEMVTEGGTYALQVAANAHTTILQTTIILDGDKDITTRNLYPDDLWNLVNDEVFETVLGHPLPKPDPIFPYTRISPLADLQYRAFGRMILRIVDQTIKNKMTSATNETDRKMIEETKKSLPLKSLTSFAGLPPHHVNALIHVLNRRYLKAIRTMITKKG